MQIKTQRGSSCYFRPNGLEWNRMDPVRASTSIVDRQSAIGEILGSFIDPFSNSNPADEPQTGRFGLPVPVLSLFFPTLFGPGLHFDIYFDPLL